MKTTLYLIAILSLASVSYAQPFSLKAIYSEMNATAQALKTPENIDAWVENSFIWARQGINKDIVNLWITGVGDCTEFAKLKCKLNNFIGVKCRTVHGYTEYGRHDAAEWKINNTWVNKESDRFSYWSKKGLGIWS